jgi:hypothetical protein
MKRIISKKCFRIRFLGYITGKVVYSVTSLVRTFSNTDYPVIRIGYSYFTTLCMLQSGFE